MSVPVLPPETPRLAPPEPPRETWNGPETPSPETPSPVTTRAVVLGAVLIVGNCWWMMALWGRRGYESGQSFPTVVSLYFNVIFTLLVVRAGNAVLGRIRPRRALG